MLLQVFSIYDSKVEAYLQPFFAPTKGAAIRYFSDAIADPQHQFFKHCEDFTLFHLGSYDDSGGLFDCDAPVSVGNAVEFKPKEH